jgi:hypothetical protein
VDVPAPRPALSTGAGGLVFTRRPQTGHRRCETARPAEDALRRFTLVRHHDTPTASSRPALTETPQRNQRHWDRPINSGPRPCLLDVGFPLSGSRDRTSTADLNAMCGMRDLRSLTLAAIAASQPRIDPKLKAVKPRVALQHAAAAVSRGPASRSRRHCDLFRSGLHSSSYIPRRLVGACLREAGSGGVRRWGLAVTS